MKVFYKNIDISENDNYSFSDYELENNDTLLDFLVKKYPEGFDNEKVIFLNKKKIDLDNDYNIKLKENDLITLSDLPQATILIMIVVNIVISIILSQLMKPKKPYQVQKNSVYSNNINQIAAALNDSVQIQYGTMRYYPKKIANDYMFYINNMQYLCVHTCLGVGSINVKNTYLNDTNINELVDNNQVLSYTEKTGNKYNYLNNLKDNFVDFYEYLGVISHKPEELKQIQINDQYQEIGYTNINEKDTKIDKVLINISFDNGIFDVDSEGSDKSSYVNINFKLVEIDSEDNETGYVSEKSFSGSFVSRTAIRRTIVFGVKSGRYKILIKRLDELSGNNDTKQCTLNSVIGLESESGMISADNFTISTFLVKVGEGFSQSSGLKVNVEAERDSEVGADDKENNFKTLLEFVKDIWTNKIYGMSESLDYLDIRADLNEEVNLILDKKEKAFDQLSAVLKSFGYIIYPYLNNFVIRKEEKIDYRSVLFNSNNSKSITFSYKLQEDNELEEGVQGMYIEKGDIQTKTISYPEDMKSYSKTLLLGINNEADATKALKIFYNKKTKQIKSCQIKTDLEGLIPEIGSRIGVSTEYLDNTIVSKVVSIINGTITLSQKFKFEKDKQYYCVIETENNDTFSNIYVNPFYEDTFTNVINTDLNIDLVEECVATIGDRVEIIEDYILTNIKPGEFNEDLQNPTEVNLILKEYNPEIYDTI